MLKKVLKKRNGKLVSVYAWAANYKSPKPIKPDSGPKKIK